MLIFFDQVTRVLDVGETEEPEQSHNRTEKLPVFEEITKHEPMPLQNASLMLKQEEW